MNWRDLHRGERDATDRRRTEAGVATIDEALECGRVTAMDPEERTLQELALELRAQAPEPSEDFLRTLDDRVAAGFPRAGDGRVRRLEERFLPGRGQARGPSRFVLRRPSLPVLAGAASVLAALLVAGSVLTSTPPDTTQTSQDFSAADSATPVPPETALEPEAQPPVETDSGAGAAARDQRVEELSLGRSTVPPAPVPPPPDADAGAGRENRQVERSAHIELAAPAEDLDRVGEGIAQIADRRGGFVLSSSLSTGQGGTAGGTFEVRVPVDELEATIAELSHLAEVRSLTQSGQDLTAHVVTTGKAAERARAKRAELEDRLAVEEGAADERRLRQRIDALTAELRSARQQGRDLERRVSFASVSVVLVEGEGAQGTLGGALDDMLGLLEGALALALRVLGVAIPVGLVAALVVAVARAGRRRRRESALAQ
jgi:hypothetical protein